METLKAFLETEIVKGTFENPLFRASDIGKVLKIDIETSTQHFNDTEKVANAPDEQASFLTEKGFYKILFESKDSIAEEFQNGIYEIIKEIRLTGKYEDKIELRRRMMDTISKDQDLSEKFALCAALLRQRAEKLTGK
jgi:prophage antirepressor-like protein